MDATLKKSLLILLILSLLCFNVVFAEDALDDASDFSEGLAAAGIWHGKMLYGYINKTGNWEIQPQFSYAGNFSDGNAVIGVFKGSEMKYGYIRKDGSYIIEPKYDSAVPFKNGFATVGIKKAAGGYTVGLINKNGEFIIPINYEYVSSSGYYFEKGIIEIYNAGKYGFVDLNTNLNIQPRFKGITFYEDNRLKATVSEVINGKERFGIIFNDGTMIEPKFDWLHYSEGIKDALFKVELDGKFGLIGTRGNYILEPKYDEIRGFQDGFTQVKLNNKYGYLKGDGSFLTEIKFDDTSAFMRGVAIVKENGKWGFLRTDGSYIGKPIYDEVFTFEGDTATVVLNGKKGLLKRDGTYKLEPIYDYFAPNSEDGTTKVVKDGKETILNSDGSKAIKVDYDTIGEYENGVARITLKEKVGYLKKDGTYLVKPVWDGAFKDYEKDYYHIQKSNQWGLVLPDSTVIEPVSNQPVTYKDGYATIYVDGKYTYMKKNGEYLTKEKFDYVEPFSDGMGRVTINYKTAYINEKGELSKIYQFGDDYNEGVACVFVGDGYIFINKNGENAFPAAPKFGMARSFSSNLAAVWSNGKWGYINLNGEIAIQHNFDKAFPFYKGIAAVKANNKYGFIDKNGKYIIEPKYDMISAFENGTANVWVGETYGYINESGTYFAGVNGNTNLKFNEGFMAVGIVNDENYGTKWGYLKQDGTWLVKPQFDFANYFSNGVGYVHLNGKTGTVDKNGTVTWK